MHAYVLIETNVGRETEVAYEASRIDGVTSAQTAMGPFDVIVRAESSGFEDIARCILRRIEGIDGITQIVTCVVLGEQTGALESIAA